MWYVIQTKSGEEQELRELIGLMIPRGLYKDCFVPFYEDVWRRGGTGHISIRRLFPGYLFIDTEEADELFACLKKIPRYNRLLGMPEKDGSTSFIRVREEEMAFLSSLLQDGVMRVSFIRMQKGSGRIESIRGPLAAHATGIVKLDVPHRRAIVETELFGQLRRIKFGLWTDMDPRLPSLAETEVHDFSAMNKSEEDIGIRPGDSIVDDSGVYGELVMKVLKVDPRKRTVKTRVNLFGGDVDIELYADDVRVV